MVRSPFGTWGLVAVQVAESVEEVAAGAEALAGAVAVAAAPGTVGLGVVAGGEGGEPAEEEVAGGGDQQDDHGDGDHSGEVVTVGSGRENVGSGIVGHGYLQVGCFGAWSSGAATRYLRR
jgi:hypothetical protein